MLHLWYNLTGVVCFGVNCEFCYFLQSLLSPPATNIQPLPEYKSTVAKKPRWVLSHYGMIKTCWDILVLLATIYVAIVVPYNAAFQVLTIAKPQNL